MRASFASGFSVEVIENKFSRRSAVRSSTWLGVMFQDVVRTGKVMQDGGGSKISGYAKMPPFSVRFQFCHVIRLHPLHRVAAEQQPQRWVLHVRDLHDDRRRLGGITGLLAIKIALK